jgi:hypothetical protein
VVPYWLFENPLSFQIEDAVPYRLFENPLSIQIEGLENPLYPNREQDVLYDIYYIRH